MAYSLDADKSTIWRTLKADSTILSLLDLTGKSLTDMANAYILSQSKMNVTVTFELACELVIANSILKRSKYDDLQGTQKRLNIYFRPSRSSQNITIKNEVLQIDCHVPMNKDFIADRTIGRVVDILSRPDFKINGRPLHFDGQLGELQTAAGFYCCGCRFSYYTPY